MAAAPGSPCDPLSNLPQCGAWVHCAYVRLGDGGLQGQCGGTVTQAGGACDGRRALSCAAPMVCVGQVCVQPAAVGAPCDPNAAHACAQGLACAIQEEDGAATCAARPGAGEECLGLGCKDFLYCDTSTQFVCEPEATPGAACDPNAEFPCGDGYCAATDGGYACSTAHLKVGAPCPRQTPFSCEPGLVCMPLLDGGGECAGQCPIRPG